MFIGQYPGILSVKRRLAVPKKFRDELGKKLVVAKWYEGCLVVISVPKWNALLDRLTGVSKVITSPVRDTDRFILGSAFEVEPDDQGRIVIPEALTQYAHIKTNITFLGLGDRIEIWDQGKWTEREKYISENASEMVEKLAQTE
jgi:MraZ protein